MTCHELCWLQTKLGIFMLDSACGLEKLFLRNICEAKLQITSYMMNYVHISGSGVSQPIWQVH